MSPRPHGPSPLSLFVAVVASCGGDALPSNGAASDAGSDVADSTPTNASTFLTVVQPGNGLCLPEQLQIDPTGSEVPCEIVEVSGAGDGGTTCDAAAGLTPASATLAAYVLTTWSLDAPATVCVLAQLPASACSDAMPGWCYLAGAAAAPCPQTIHFTAAVTPAVGTTFGLACQSN
jgi:hypothetical protein